MVTVPLEWRISVSGAESLRQQLSDINNQFQRGEISVSDYGKELRTIRRDTLALNSQTSLSNRLFLAQYPAINQLSRGFSSLSHVASSALQISRSLNLMFMRQQGETQVMAILQRDLAEATRDYNRALKEGDLKAQADSMERINIATAGIREEMDKMSFSKLDNLLLTFGSFGALASGIVMIFSKGGPIGLIIAGVALAVLAIITFREEIAKALTIDLPIIFGKAAQYLTNFFFKDLPNWINNAIPLVREGFIAFSNAVITVINNLGSGLIGGLNVIISAIQSFVNSMISVYNSIASKLSKLGVKIPKISPITLPTVTFTAIPLIAAAHGFEGMVNSPTMFLAGEAGQEMVSITPRNKGGGQVTLVANFYNHGSIATENEFFHKWDQWFKTQLRKQGFSGF